MADTVAITAGSGTTIATDDLGAAGHVQRVKAVLGADGTGVDPIAISAALDSTGAGVPAVGILAQFDDAATATVTENQFAAPRISTRRALLVEGVASGTAQPISGTVTASNTAGDVAHDTGDSGNPVKIGGRAISAVSTATMVAAADRTDFMGDLDGLQLNRPYCTIGDILQERLSDTGGTSSASTVFGATASTRNIIHTIMLYNDSTTNCYVDIRDGAAGTVIATMPCPAKGGSITNLPVPLRTTANTALAFDVSAAITTVYLTFIGYKSKA